MSHRQYPWQDPYAGESESGTEDNVEDHHFAGDAQVQPMMGSLYASATRPGAQQIHRPATAHPHEPLMYSPRSTQQRRQQLSSSYSPSSPSLQQQQRPIDSRTRRHSDQATPGHHSYSRYNTHHEEGIGVGFILPPNSQEEEEDAQDAYPASALSLPQEPYRTTLQAARPSHPAVHHQRPPPQTTTTAPLPTIQLHKPPLPEYKPLEPDTPTPRRNKRFLETALRVPDICNGTVPSSQNVGNQNVHLVMCEACRTKMQANQNSVLVKCRKCRHVSSATPVMGRTKSGFGY